MNTGHQWAVLGLGRVGRCFAHVLHDADALSVAWSRRPAATRNIGHLGLPTHHGAVPNLTDANIVAIALPDDALARFVSTLPAALRERPDVGWIHFSGRAPSTLFDPLVAGSTASLHPLRSFTGTDADRRALQGTFVALEGRGAALSAAQWLAEQVDADAHKIDANAKSAYHAAATLVSNGTYALLRAAERICADSGLDPAVLTAAFASLAKNSASNAIARPLTEATTGPVVRGDATTVQAHLDTLIRDRKATDLYRATAEWLVDIAEEGTTAPSAIAAIEAVLASAERG